MSNFIDRIIAEAQRKTTLICLPEGNDPRVRESARKIVELGIADVVLLDETGQADSLASEHLQVISPGTDSKRQAYAHLLHKLRRHKGMSEDRAWELSADPNYFGTLMVKAGHAQGLVSGACHSTADTLRPALQILKTAPGVSLVSSFMLMDIPGCPGGEHGVFLFSDIGLNVAPDAENLAEIAMASAKSWETFMSSKPHVAMLSYSTLGSAQGEVAERVQKATALVHKAEPDLLCDGDLQVDAALVDSVAQLKAPESQVAGKANILIFPDLASGNIGYKLVQRLGHAQAIGPILQGIAAPVNDLSRGCSIDDIIAVAAITAVQAQTCL